MGSYGLQLIETVLLVDNSSTLLLLVYDFIKQHRDVM
jgi:hypothetical protein